MKKSNYFFHFFVSLSILVLSGNLLAQSDIVPLDRKLKSPDIISYSENKPPDNNSDAIIINVPGSYPTIQAAINAANNGDIIVVAAGIYRENITLNKYVQLRGSNFTVNPNTGIRGPETIIQPATSDPDPNSLTAVNIFYISTGGSGSIIDGFTFDGDNNTINSGVIMNGADVDAVEAISAYDGLSNTNISNNIIKNLNYAGIDLYNYTNGGASTYDNLITNNKFDNIIPASYGIGVLLYNNCYTSVLNNVMTRVRIGVQTGNFYNADIGSNHSISHNEIESSRLGIFHNLAYTNASAYTLDSNNITTVAGSTNNNGILVSSFQGAVAVNMNDNDVSNARIGFNLWNCPTSSTITVTGGSVSNCNVGVFANNFDGYSSDAVSSIFSMTGVTFTNCDTSIKIKDNDLNTNNATVALNVNNTTNIVNGTGIGLLIEGGDASVVFNGAAPVDFSTSLSTYIRLATNGTNVPSALINAQTVQFGGANGTALSNAQLFAVEDKIDHKIDWSDLGFVSVKANNDYVTVNSFYTPNTSSALIQSGIDLAVPGDTVNVGTGSFTEQLEINKALVLTGQGSASTNIISPNILTLSFTTSAVNKPVIYVHDASSVFIKDLTVDGAGKGNANYRFQGIAYRNAGGNVRDCEVKSIRNTPIDGSQHGIGIFAQADDGNTRTLDISNNNIYDFQKNATSFSGADLTVNLDSNTVTGAGPVSFIAQNGIQVGFGAGGSVTNNEISNISYVPSTVVSCGVLLYQPAGPVTTFKNSLTGCQVGIYYIDVGGDISENTINSTLANMGTVLYWGIDADPGDRPRVPPQPLDDENLSKRNNSNGTTNANAITTNIFRNVLISDGTNGTAIEMDALGTETLNANATENKVNGWDAGVVFYKDAGATLNGIANDNDLSGNTYSVYDLTGVTQNATCNWFGSTDVPTILSGISGAVNFIPFGTDGTDNDFVTIGFQPVPGSCNGVGPVKNITQNLTYVAIQPAITAANNGDTIEVSAGTYDEQVLVNKGVLIKGVGASMPVVDFTGTVAGKPTVFDVSVRDVKLENLRIRVDMTKLNSAVIASGTDIDNFNITNDSVEAYGSSAAGTFGSYGNRNAVSINYGGPTNYRIASGGVDNVNVQGLTVSGVLNDGFNVARFFRAGVSCDEVGGAFNGNTLQSINHDLLVRFGGNGNVDFKNNNFNGGGAEISDMNAGAGVITISDNVFDATFANSSSPGTAVLRLKNNYNSKTTLVNRNTISNHQWAVSLENYNTVALDSNVFTPLANSTVFHHVTVNNKSISTNSNTIVQVAIDAVLTNNVFNYSGTAGGTALSFHNHDNDAATYGTFNIGTLGNENSFNTGIQNFIYLDAQAGASNTATFPDYNSLIGAGAGAITTMACWTVDLNIENNKFDVGSGLQLPAAMSFSERSALETNLYHKPDNACLANLTYFMPVHNITQNTYFMTIQAAVNAANPSDQIECAEYSYNERVTIDKKLTLEGVNKTNCIVEGAGLAGTGRGILVSNGVKGVTIKNLTVQNFAGSNGNTDAGIYAIGGNDTLTVSNVILQNNVGGSGFYANGPINTVTIDSVTSSGHTSSARGIVIWNGLKENITITNCEVFNNNCCGIELQDGQASGVTIESNNIHDNADNGIGVVGLQGPGENLIKLNTLVNNGRFGIEIKNPDGSGLATGPGRVVIEDNNVSRNIPIVDNRDIVGIAAFRRGVLAGNVDIPVGAVIQNNTVSGYIQPSTSDGFGIVVEGLNHTVSGNTVSSCDVGIQRQAGHLPGPPGDGDQSNLADTYFGRGNSPTTCGIILSSNILTNTINTRDVGANAGAGMVKNLNTLEMYCSIQAAINDVLTLNGHVIEVTPGTYNERVTVSKSLTIQGTDKTTCLVDGAGLAGTGRGFLISNGVKGVTLKNLTVQNFAGSNGNTDAGIYAIGGNDTLTVSNVILQNNVGGSGFYANGPINTVLIDSVTSSGHTSNARGIVIWNGLKENITITNCEVFNNNCCGIELQDGQASGVTIENNNIHDNGDNGIGIVGLQGPGENLVKLNILVNNGRFGIEIKNPNGSGLATGPGRVVVEDNNVSRNIPIVDNRDIVGIAAFRRGVLPGNVDIPNGVVIQNNTIAGYVQTSTSEGFGIVVEGTSHTVSGNTVSGCDVGIQRQAGHLPGPPGDGDQSNLADNYFGRGNSPQTCGITISGNILTNTINTRDVGASAGGLVTNINTNGKYCSIQAAISDVLTINGHTIEVSAGTYDEQVLVNKGVLIKGVGTSMPVVDFTGTVAGKPTVFDVSVRDVKLENLRIRVDMTKLNSAVIASGTDIDNFNITNDSVEAYGSSAAGTFGSYGNRNAVSINYGGPTNYRIASGGVDNVNVQGLTVSGVLNDGFNVARFFRAGVSCDEVGGAFNGNTLQSINHDILVRFGSNGNVEYKNNNFIGGGAEISDMNAGAGVITISDNVFDATFANSSSPGTAVLRLKNNYNSKTTLVNRNTISNHQWAVSLENYNTVTLDSNVFTPLANSTVFHHVTVNNKSISTNSNTIVQVAIDAVLTNNVFNYSGTAGGTALSFHNHDNDAATYGTFNIGTLGNENSFNTGIQNFIYLDDQTGASNTAAFPDYNSLIGAGAGAITTMACWTVDLNIENNKFDVGSGLQLPAAMSFSERSALETNLYHKPDNACLANLTYFMPVHNITQNTYFMTIQAAVNAANPSDQIECAEYSYNERVTIDKKLTLEGVNKTNCIVEGAGLAGTGRGILVSNGVKGVTIKNLTVQNFAGSNGNTDAGIYAIGGNDTLTVSNVILQNNVGGSGFYANGPINTVTIDSVTSSGHTSSARGIVIWNGLKENITITNCEVFNNNCCGIELQDGQASGVTIENNNIHDNADNGIGVVGLQGPGENLIKLNTLVNNGRFGIEIKNPDGSGLATGPGRVVIEDNNVSRNIPIVDNRDIVGIAAFRRGVLAGNVDIPVGAVIQNNTVSGYIQPSTSDGFGIVVEGLNHTVSGNTVSGCDVGIQRQAGHLPGPPGDGDQSNLADTYFGRGNSPQTCGIVIVGNILTNTIDTRDVGAGTGSGIVKNLNTLETFCSIQSAINDTETLNGHTLAIDSGYYNESVMINKEVELVGAGAAPNSRPVVEGVSGETFSVTVPNVTINNIIVKFNQGTVNTGIRAATSGTFNNLTVKKCCVFGTATTGAAIFNSFGIQTGTFGGVQYDQVNLDSNEISHTGTSPLGRGVKTFNCYGDWSHSNINAYYSIQCGDIQGGLLNITNDSLFGTAEINSLGTGSHTFSNNVCNVANAFGSGTDYALLELKNISNGTANLLVSGNIFENFVNFGIFSGRSNNVTIDNNTFTPDPTAPNFRSIRLDTKQRTVAPQGVFVSGAVIIKNTFNGNAALGQAGISLQLANSDSISSFGTVTVGGSGNENNFNTNVLKYISLNNETTSTSGDPVWYATYISTKGKVNVNIDARNNNFDAGAGLQLPTVMTLTNLFSLEDKVQHKIDDGGLGFVLVKTNNDYVTVNSFVVPTITTPSVQRGIDAASTGFTVNVGPGNFTEQLEINKALTLDGQGSGITNIISPNTLTLSYTTSGVNKPVIYVHDASDVAITDLTVDGAGKGNANNRFQGIAYRNAGGKVDSCEIKAVRNTPIDGAQAGVGIYALADDGNTRTLDVTGNYIHDFQKNATVFAGVDLYARIDSNTITGAGPVSFIAQNGVQLSTGASGSIRYNTISGLSYVPSTYISTGILLYQSTGPDTTSYNVLTGCQMGIYYIDVGGVISENTLTTNAVNTGTTYYWGIDADPGGKPRVKSSPADEPAIVSNKRSNVLDNSSSISTWIFRNVLISTGNNGTGIEMDALGTEILNATASENYVNGWEAAIFFYKDAGATLNGVANENELSGNTYSIYNQTGVIQNATCNWFGTTDPPTIAAGISGVVNYAPYLTNGTDSDAPTMGFQPVPASCNGVPASTINIKVIPQGFYNTSTQKLNMRDTVRAYLHSNISPYNVLDSAISVIDSVTFTGAFTFNQPSGTYYIVVKHRNSIETWSKAGGEPFVAASVMNYDFTDLSSKAYNNSLVQVNASPLTFGIYSGDIDQDGSIEFSDVLSTSNDISNFINGYVQSDVTGNNIVELSDLVIVNNNSAAFVIVQKP